MDSPSSAGSLPSFQAPRNKPGKHRFQSDADQKPFQRRRLIDDIKKKFTHCPTSHGALVNRVLLVSPPGLGKRTAAAQAAKEITDEDGRRILWINGINSSSFIRDYCSAYQQLTELPLPRGLDIDTTMGKIKYHLEERRQDWFMVITDYGNFVEDEHRLTPYLPDRGQILVTTKALILPTRYNRRDKKSALLFSHTADEIEVAGLRGEEVHELARQLSPTLSRISFTDFGQVQQGSRAVPLFLKITSLNLWLLRLDFASYRKIFEKETYIVQGAKQSRFFSFNDALNVALRMMWNALSNYDSWATRLLALLSVIFCSPVPLGLVEALPLFANTVIDHLSPALSLLTSLEVITLSYEDSVPHVAVIHHEVAQWVVKRIRRTFSREEKQQLLATWAGAFHQELCVKDPKTFAFGSPSGISFYAFSTMSYDPVKVWTYLPLLQSLISLIDFGLALFMPSAASAKRSNHLTLTFLLNVAETLVTETRLGPHHAKSFVDEAFRTLVTLGFHVPAYQGYLIRIKLIRVASHLAALDRVAAEQDLAIAKRSLRILSRHKEPFGEQIPDLVPGLQSDASPASTESAQPGMISLTTQADVFRQRMGDLEAQLRCEQRRFGMARTQLPRLPPTPTSLSDRYALAKRLYWTAYAMYEDQSDGDLSGPALLLSHAAMNVWLTFSEEERWGRGEKVDVDILTVVSLHVDLLMTARKYRGALLFLPKLLDVWLEFSPLGGLRLWKLGRKLVECYVYLDMVREAEKVVERMLEVRARTAGGMNELAGSIEPSRNEIVATAYEDWRDTFWGMLIELARGYEIVGSVIVAEGILRFCLGSWRRRYVNAIQPREIVYSPFMSKTEKRRVLKEQEEEDARVQKEREEREKGWKKTAPLHWWSLFINILVMQGKIKEPTKLVDELMKEFDVESLAPFELPDQVLRRGIETYREMRDIYQRALWVEEEGWLREWKIGLGESASRYYLRRAVRAFGSVSRRVREQRPFAADIDLNLFSHANRSKILHDLDRTWAHKYGFAPQIWIQDRHCDEDVATLPIDDKGQTQLCSLWQWCRCRRKRNRAYSIDFVEVNDKWFIRDEERKAIPSKSFTQTTLDDWLYFIVPPPPTCDDSCPCIAANLRGLCEQAELEKKLWTYKEPLRPHQVPMSKTKRLYRGEKVKFHGVPVNEVFLDTRDQDYDKSKGIRVWKWCQPEIMPSETEGNNYILPLSLDAPYVKITTVEDEDSDINATDSQGESKRRRKKPDPKWWFNNPQDYVTLARREDITPYLVLDEATKAKFEGRRACLFLDRGYRFLEAYEANSDPSESFKKPVTETSGVVDAVDAAPATVEVGESSTAAVADQNSDPPIVNVSSTPNQVQLPNWESPGTVDPPAVADTLDINTPGSDPSAVDSSVADLPVTQDSSAPAPVITLDVHYKDHHWEEASGDEEVVSDCYD
jgi:hypothetical protein